MSDTSDLKDSVVKLLELSQLDSPFTPNLLKVYREELIDSLIKANKIDQDTAQTLR